MAQRVKDSYDLEKEEAWKLIDGVTYTDPKVVAEQLYLEVAELPPVDPHVHGQGRASHIEPGNEHFVGTAVCQKLVGVLAEAMKHNVGDVVVLSTECEDIYAGRQVLSNSKNMSMVAITKEAAERLLPLYDTQIRPVLDNIMCDGYNLGLGLQHFLSSQRGTDNEIRYSVMAPAFGHVVEYEKCIEMPLSDTLSLERRENGRCLM